MNSNDLLLKTYHELIKNKYEIKLNQKQTEIIFKNCVFCRNPNWNLELNLVDKFVFHCWACDQSGSASQLLKILNINPLFLKKIAEKEKKLYGKNFFKPKEEYFDYEKIKYFYEYNEEKIFYNDIQKLLYQNMNKYNWKIISYKKPFSYKKIKIYNGFLCLGLLRRGLFAIDLKTKFSFKTQSDIFIYNENNNKNSIIFIEGFFDLIPHFIDQTAIILTQTNMKIEYLNILAEYFKNRQNIYLCLDKKAESYLLRNIKKSKLILNKKIYVFEPYKGHSPKDSEFIFLKKII